MMKQKVPTIILNSMMPSAHVFVLHVGRGSINHIVKVHNFFKILFYIIESYRQTDHIVIFSKKGST